VTIPKASVLYRTELGRMPEETFQVQAINSDISIQYGLDSSVDAYSFVKVSVAAWFAFRPTSPQQADCNGLSPPAVGACSGEGLPTDRCSATVAIPFYCLPQE
jgi:hypothetical protein